MYPGAKSEDLTHSHEVNTRKTSTEDTKGQCEKKGS
jgi:hypothetical protein